MVRSALVLRKSYSRSQSLPGVLAWDQDEDVESSVLQKAPQKLRATLVTKDHKRMVFIAHKHLHDHHLDPGAAHGQMDKLGLFLELIHKH